MFLLDVTLQFDKACRELCKRWIPENTKDAIRFVKTHERKPIVLRNLCNQIRIQETKNHARLDAGRKNMIVEAAAQMFIGAIMKERQEKYKISSAETQRLKDEAKCPIEEAKEILGDSIKITDNSTSI